MNTNAMRMNTPYLLFSIKLGADIMSEPQNKAFAGVGKPIKPIVCRSSRLNFANLNAENAAMINATYGR